MAIETYAFSAFPDNDSDPARLHGEIEDSSISSAALVGVSRDPVAQEVDIEFDQALSAPDKTTLDGIVADHKNQPVELDPPITSRSMVFTVNGEPLVTSDGELILSGES